MNKAVNMDTNKILDIIHKKLSEIEQILRDNKRLDALLYLSRCKEYIDDVKEYL